MVNESTRMAPSGRRRRVFLLVLPDRSHTFQPNEGGNYAICRSVYQRKAIR
jgi:hypothetical protein